MKLTIEEFEKEWRSAKSCDVKSIVIKHGEVIADAYKKKFLDNIESWWITFYQTDEEDSLRYKVVGIDLKAILGVNGIVFSNDLTNEEIERK